MVDRPALDEPGGIEAAVRVPVEVAVGLLPELLAAGKNVLHVRRRVADSEFAPREAADLALRLVRGERRVDGSEPLEHGVDGVFVRVDVADIDKDRHAHDLLDPADTGGPDRGRHHAFLAWRIAAWSDCTNA